MIGRLKCLQVDAASRRVGSAKSRGDSSSLALRVRVDASTRAIRLAFTLIEATVALSITTICGASLLLALESSLDTTDNGLEQLQAQGMAAQLMHEIAARRYCASGGTPYEWPGGPNATEKQGSGRERYDDIDDMNGYTSKPPTNALGYALGADGPLAAARHTNFQAAGSPFANWRQNVEMYYVSEADPKTRLAAGQTSNLRCIAVTIYEDQPGRTSRVLAELKRVFAYVPGP